MNKDIKIARLEKQLATANENLKMAKKEIRGLKRDLDNSGKKKGVRTVVLTKEP